MDHAYWGPSFCNETIREVLAERGDELQKQGCTGEKMDDEPELFRLTAQAVAEGKVIGWFQGRMEWALRVRWRIGPLSAIRAGRI